MKQQEISTGQAARISGLTIRTLQHYDNIGLLPASGRTEGGRRYYTDQDMIRLEHVVFYRSLGFSLKQIKEKLMDTAARHSADQLLEMQKSILYNQIYNAQNGIAAIEASQEIAAAGNTPPWALLAAFMQSLGTVDVSTWGDFEFTTEQMEIFTEHLPTIDDIMDFYNTWRRLSIKAAAFCEAGIGSDTPAAQLLAAEWTAMVQKATGGKDAHTSAYLEVDQQREMWSPAERDLIEKAEPFLLEILAFYESARESH